MNNNSVQNIQAIAQTELEQYITGQAQEIAPEPKLLCIPQRRAKYHDKTRVRFKDVQGWVFARTGLNTSRDVKAALKKLGYKLNLRLTVSWIYINLHLVYEIAASKPKDNLQKIVIKVGDRVNITEYPANLVHIHTLAPFVVRAIEGDKVFLDYVATAISANQIAIAS